jgi:hypothetical protein
VVRLSRAKWSTSTKAAGRSIQKDCSGLGSDLIDCFEEAKISSDLEQPMLPPEGSLSVSVPKDRAAAGERLRDALEEATGFEVLIAPNSLRDHVVISIGKHARG